MIAYRANTKAGRAWIEAILAATTLVNVRKRDLVTDRVELKTLWRDSDNGRIPMPDALRGAIVDRYTHVYDPGDTGGRTYYVVMVTGRVALRYEITTYAFDVSGLPDVKPEEI